MKLNAKAALRAITHNEMIELQMLCENHLGIPQPGEMLRKVISLKDAEKFHLGLNKEKEKIVFGFLTKMKDYTIPNSSEELIENLRLDYIDSPFKKENGFAVIEFSCPNESKIVHPFMDGAVVKDSTAPYTNTGMTGSSKTIIPEYYAPQKYKSARRCVLILVRC